MNKDVFCKKLRRQIVLKLKSWHILQREDVRKCHLWCRVEIRAVSAAGDGRRSNSWQSDHGYCPWEDREVAREWDAARGGVRGGERVRGRGGGGEGRGAPADSRILPRWTRTTRTPSRAMATGRRPMASISSASGTMTALPAKIRSAARVSPAAATGMGRTATAWVTPTSTTSISIISPHAAFVDS